MLRFVLFFFTLSVSAVVQGSVVIMGTRVVYPATQKSIVTNGAIVIHTQRLKSDPGGNLLS